MIKADVKRIKARQWATELAIEHSIEKHRKAVARLMALKVSLRVQTQDQLPTEDGR